MKTRMIAALGLLSLAATACSSTDPGGFGGAPDDEPSLVLRIEYEGGFVPVEWNFSRQPTLVVMSDGRLYTTPAMIEIYPPPLQTGYEVRRVTQAAIDAIRDRAEQAGLTEDGDIDPTEDGGATIADAATTVFIYVEADGTSHRVSAYALSEMDETGRREQLAQFNRDMMDLSWLPEGSMIDEGSIEPAAAIKVGVRPYKSVVSGDDGAGLDGEELKQPEKDWPLDEPLETFGDGSNDNIVQRCGVLTGSDLETFIEASGGANTMTPWVSGGKRYHLLIDPMTPDEDPTC